MEGNRVAVIGAGIAGLTAAIFLRRIPGWLTRRQSDWMIRL